MKKKSWRRNHEGESHGERIIEQMEETNIVEESRSIWKHLGNTFSQKAPRKHPGDTHEAPREHLGVSQRYPEKPKSQPRNHQGFGRQVNQIIRGSQSEMTKSDHSTVTRATQLSPGCVPITEGPA